MNRARLRRLFGPSLRVRLRVCDLLSDFLTSILGKDIISSYICKQLAQIALMLRKPPADS